MFPITRLGPLSLPSAELIVIIFFYLGITLFEKLQRSKGKDPDPLSNVLLTSVFVFVIVGRIGFALENFSNFMRSPVDIISLNRDLFDPWLAFFGAIAYFIFALNKKNISVWPSLDDLSVFVISLIVGGSIANIASGAAFGITTNSVFGIDLWGARRFPAQFLDLALNLALLAFVLLSAKKELPDGVKFLSMLFLFAAGQIIAQGFRAEGIILSAGLRFDQLVYFVIAAVTGWKALKMWERKNG